MVRALLDGRVEAGRHAVRWEGRSSEGQVVGGGVYFARLEVLDRETASRFVLLQ